MSEFAELERLINESELSFPIIKAEWIAGLWHVTVNSGPSQVTEHNEYRLDTALTLVLQDLRDMANK